MKDNNVELNFCVQNRSPWQLWLCGKLEVSNFREKV